MAAIFAIFKVSVVRANTSFVRSVVLARNFSRDQTISCVLIHAPLLRAEALLCLDEQIVVERSSCEASLLIAIKK